MNKPNFFNRLTHKTDFDITRKHTVYITNDDNSPLTETHSNNHMNKNFFSRIDILLGVFKRDADRALYFLGKHKGDKIDINISINGWILGQKINKEFNDLSSFKTYMENLYDSHHCLPTRTNRSAIRP